MLYHQDIMLVALFNYHTLKLMNRSSRGLMFKLDIHVLITTGVRQCLISFYNKNNSIVGAAKTIQRKARGGKDFGANYKIVPMSSKYD